MARRTLLADISIVHNILRYAATHGVWEGRSLCLKNILPFERRDRSKERESVEVVFE